MKKFIAIFTASLLCLACNVSNEQTNGRNISKMSSISAKLFTSFVEYDVTIIDNCMRVNDFIDASEEKRKTEKYAGIGYYPKENKFVIDGFGEILTYGKRLTASGMKWDVNLSYSWYQRRSVTYSGDMVWKLKPESDDGRFIENGHEFTIVTEVRHAGRNFDKRNLWDCSISGICKESDNYWLAFYSKQDIRFDWTTKTQGSSVTNTLSPTGKFRHDYYINNSLTDWYEIEYQGGLKYKEQSSVD